ncbi:hypothetical protein HK096_003164 [Nowakowskiella sp. JEL0078]|nr:hypothetical protein HK096_003164 [Nowakowskiella sp. JEL0078]
MLEFSCVSEIKTVYRILDDKGGLAVLEDDLIIQATQEIISDGKSRSKVQYEIKQKERAIELLSKKYSSLELTTEDIKQCLYSIGDNHAFLRTNRDPCDKIIEWLKIYFTIDEHEKGYSLAIQSGKHGARLTHDHTRQYSFVLQSLTLWREVLHDMFQLWYLAEQDLLDEGNPYRLKDTGQGLNRVQNAPRTSRIMHNILHKAQQKVGSWVGSSVIHLGDHNVPNSLFLIDKYTQIHSILNPVVLVLDQIETLSKTDEGVNLYIGEVYGGIDTARKDILVDFFRHGFDGSGADNFFDAGSCVDGRLTSAWNWCHNIHKKKYYSLFKLCGFIGFDSDAKICMTKKKSSTKKGKKSKSKSTESYASNKNLNLVSLPTWSDNISDLVTLRVIQNGWEFHDFLITISKSASIYMIQCEISKHQHDGAVYPSDINLFKQKPLSWQEEREWLKEIELNEENAGNLEILEQLQRTLTSKKSELISESIFTRICDCIPGVKEFNMLDLKDNTGSHIVYSVIALSMSSMNINTGGKIASTLAELERLNFTVGEVALFGHNKDDNNIIDIAKKPIKILSASTKLKINFPSQPPHFLTVEDIHNQLSEIKTYIKNIISFSSRSHTHFSPYSTKVVSSDPPSQQFTNIHDHVTSEEESPEILQTKAFQPQKNFLHIISILPPNTPHAVTVYYDIKQASTTEVDDIDFCSQFVSPINNKESLKNNPNVSDKIDDDLQKFEQIDLWKPTYIKSSHNYIRTGEIIMTHGIWDVLRDNPISRTRITSNKTTDWKKTKI